MTVDTQNRLWISLGYNGLLSVDGGEWAIIPKEEIPYNESEPLNAYIHSLGVDENGWFYLVKSEALTVWDRRRYLGRYSAKTAGGGLHLQDALRHRAACGWPPTPACSACNWKPRMSKIRLRIGQTSPGYSPTP